MNSSRRITLRASLVVIVLIGFSGRGIALHADENGEQTPANAAPQAEAAAAKPKPAAFDVRLSDGSVLRANLLEANIPLQTDFGKLMIPVASLRAIDFATRFPAATIERVKGAIGRLGDKDFQTRETASAELLELAGAALPALQTAVDSDDPEVVLRADRLLAQLAKTLQDDQRQIFPRDLVHTDGSQIEGTIELEALKIETLPFGVQQLKLDVIRHLGPETEAEETPTAVLPDPGVLMNFQGQTGRTLYFKITAPANNFQNDFVWGTDMYTADSRLSVAALHAGVIKPGENKVVGVTMLGPQPSFTGSARHGVSSMAFGQFPAAFKFKTKKEAGRRGAIQVNR